MKNSNKHFIMITVAMLVTGAKENTGSIFYY